jgi:GTP pyrophosphokinase
MEIYAPLAHRLGMSRVKDELEDLAFSYIDPRVYRSLKAEVAIKMAEGEKYVNEIGNSLRTKLKESGHDYVKIEGRAKHLYSIYKKMKNENKTLDEIYDIFAVRIIVVDIEECYSVLGEVHKLYTPVPGKFKDYIAMPKPNMYQSIHTTLFGPNSSYFEVQIRTVEMHKVAEFGIAAHWKYKERTPKSTGKKDEQFDMKLAWLRQILDDQQNMEDDREFMYSLKVDLFSDRVYVFTPKGDVKDLSAGSTPIDFAYSIHSAIGNKMSGAKINGRITTLDYKLKTGDVVEILTSTQTNGPSRDWLKIVKTAQARNKINQWFKKERKEENISRGKDIIEKELKKHKYSQLTILDSGRVENVLKKYNFQGIDEMYAAVGYGGISGGKIVLGLIQEYKKTLTPDEIDSVAELPTENVNTKKKTNKATEDIVVKGIENCLVRIARCCNPLPGDEIVGYITKGRGVTVHRADCKSLALNFEVAARRIDVDWGNKQQQAYVAGLAIRASDRVHLLTDITTKLAGLKIPLKGINAKVRSGGNAVMHLDLEIDRKEQLDEAIKELRKLNGVYDVVRS